MSLQLKGERAAGVKGGDGMIVWGRTDDGWTLDTQGGTTKLTITKVAYLEKISGVDEIEGAQTVALPGFPANAKLEARLAESSKPPRQTPRRFWYNTTTFFGVNGVCKSF